MSSEGNTGSSSTKNVGRNIFLFFLLINILVSGGRLPSSDETSVFLLTKSIATRAAFDIPPGITENGSYFGEKYYSWYEVGQAMTAVPFYYVAVLVSNVAPLPEKYDLLVVKAVLSLYNAVIGSLLAALFFAFSQKLGASKRAAFLLTFGLCVGTNLLPYLKSFLREPLLGLCLLASTYYLFSFHKEARDRRFLLYAGLFAGLGFLTKVTFAVNVLFLFGYCFFILSPIRRREGRVGLIYFLGPIFLALTGILLYNYARFGDILDLGYHGGTSFTTPLFVGLYGELLSSGKSMFLYAPITLLAFWSFPLFYRTYRAEALLFFFLIGANLVLHAMYMSWAGEGSWGVRYLLPILPFIILPAALLFRERAIAMRRFAIVLVVLGVIVQTGGVAIYLGNYYREIGEYPYQRGFDDPEFMYKSHFVPNYSPVIGHWRMLVRNAGEHVRGDIPRISVGGDEQLKRIPLQSDEQPKLRHTLDFWFLYPVYAGMNPAPPLAALAVVIAAFTFQALRIRKFLSEPPATLPRGTA